jgi:hypothetical protein
LSGLLADAPAPPTLSLLLAGGLLCPRRRLLHRLGHDNCLMNWYGGSTHKHSVDGTY